MAVGAGVAAWVGFTGAAAAVAAAAINGAIIGAVIGGITAAVTDGDIAMGILVGAVGGAVTGGIMGYMNPGGFLATGSTTGATSVASAGGGGTAGVGMSQSAMVAGAGSTEVYGAAAAEGLSQSAGGAAGGGLFGTGLSTAEGEVLGTAVSEGAKGLMASRAAEKDLEKQKELMAIKHEQDMEKLNAQLSQTSTGGGSDALAVAMANIAHDKWKTQQQWTREDTAAARIKQTAKGIFKPGERKLAEQQQTGGVLGTGTPEDETMVA